MTAEPQARPAPRGWPPDPPPAGTVAERKAAWRDLLRTARREVVEGQREAGRRAHGARLARRALEWLEPYAARTRPSRGLAGMTLTAHESLRTEPPVEELVALLRGAGARVLVPITLGDGALDWHLVDDPDRTPVGPGLLSEVDVAFVPGLAVDRRGVRLGKGGGYYDRALPLLTPGTPTVTVLHDHEVVAELPADPWDAPVGATLTAAAGVRPVGPRLRRPGGG